MGFLDMKTVIFSQGLTNVVCAVVMAFIWHRNRKRFSGLSFWVAGSVLEVAALLLILLRGSVPDAVSIVLSNTLMMAGILAIYMGLERFVGKTGSQVHNYVVVTVFACVHMYFFSFQPNLAARSVNASVGILILTFQCMWLLFRRVDIGMRQVTRGAGMVFGGYCLVSIIRAAVTLAGPQSGSDYFSSGALEAVLLLAYQMLFIILTYSLALMISRRLLMEVTAQEEKREKLIRELQDALARVKLLSGLLPICSSCKRIRDDKGYWTRIESYVRHHSEADFSHGICPECAKKLYPDANPYDEDETGEPQERELP
ncbi:MAG: hypothetical protein JXL84_06770 [Deltaproteobacteria bacterium]|nr:hypothetical protein [Deltaproteobacteria bacterium]